MNELSARERRYQAFFQRLINELCDRRFTDPIAISHRNWQTVPSEKPQPFVYAIAFTLGRKVRTEIYFTTGNRETNKRLFDKLNSECEPIKSAGGDKLTWERLNHRIASRIASYRPGSIDDPTEDLEEIKRWAIENLEHFKEVFPSRIEAAWRAVEAAGPAESAT